MIYNIKDWCDFMGDYFNSIKKLWNKVPDWIQGIVSFCGSLITIAAVVAVPAQIIQGILKKIFPENINPQILFPWLICVFLSVIVLILRFKIKQYKQSLRIRFDSDSNSYYNILHDFRNYYFDVLSYHKSGKLNKSFLTSITKTYLISMLDKLCDIFHAYTGSDFDACIKIIGKENENVDFDKINEENATVYTFLRSGKMKPARVGSVNNDPVLISKNTDFQYIISPPDFYRKKYFYEQNLQKFDEYLMKQHRERYQNTTEDYWDFYRAALVVPIHISRTHLYFSQKNNYHIVGFLCIDTMSTQAFIPEYEEQFVKIAKSFAAVMYIIMNKYQYYLSKHAN